MQGARGSPSPSCTTSSWRESAVLKRAPARRAQLHTHPLEGVLVAAKAVKRPRSTRTKIALAALVPIICLTRQRATPNSVEVEVKMVPPSQTMPPHIFTMPPTPEVWNVLLDLQPNLNQFCFTLEFIVPHGVAQVQSESYYDQPRYQISPLAGESSNIQAATPRTVNASKQPDPGTLQRGQINNHPGGHRTGHDSGPHPQMVADGSNFDSSFLLEAGYPQWECEGYVGSWQYVFICKSALSKHFMFS